MASSRRCPWGAFCPFPRCKHDHPEGTATSRAEALLRTTWSIDLSDAKVPPRGALLPFLRIQGDSALLHMIRTHRIDETDIEASASFFWRRHVALCLLRTMPRGEAQRALGAFTGDSANVAARNAAALFLPRRKYLNLADACAVAEGADVDAPRKACDGAAPAAVAEPAARTDEECTLCFDVVRRPWVLCHPQLGDLWCGGFLLCDACVSNACASCRAPCMPVQIALPSQKSRQSISTAALDVLLRG
jgi:hypothetical protein